MNQKCSAERHSHALGRTSRVADFDRRESHPSCAGQIRISGEKREIALQLNLSEHTVRNYLIRVFDKLGISSRVELVLYAFSGTEGNVTSENSKTFSASA